MGHAMAHVSAACPVHMSACVSVHMSIHMSIHVPMHARTGSAELSIWKKESLSMTEVSTLI